MALIAAAEANVCVCDRCFDDELFETLNGASMVQRLTPGLLLEDWTPSIMMFSAQIISRDEVLAAIAKHGSFRHLRYSVSTSGYHVLAQDAGS